MDINPDPTPIASGDPKSAVAIQEWIIAWLARELPMPAEDIDPDQTFEFYGASSLSVVVMTGELADRLKIEVDPASVYDYPTIGGFSAYVASISEAAP